VAGIKLPIVSKVEYEVSDYSRFATPMWVDAGLEFLKDLLELREKLIVIHEQEHLLQKELRKVTQRVNLFEKVMIPQATENIKTIRITLAEEQTSAVGRSKIAKSKSVN
jgi:V/A-type H+-transporting ATPase subunit D